MTAPLPDPLTPDSPEGERAALTLTEALQVTLDRIDRERHGEEQEAS